MFEWVMFTVNTTTWVYSLSWGPNLGISNVTVKAVVNFLN